MRLKDKRESRQPYTPHGAARALWGCRDEEILIEGPVGCVAGETRLYLADKGQHVPIQDLWKREIAPVVMTVNGPCQATVPFLKGIARLFRVGFQDGSSIVVTEDHKFLSCDGWVKLKDVCVGDALMQSSVCRPESDSGLCLSTSPQDDRHSIQTVQDLMGNYRLSSRFCDELPDEEKGLHLEGVPLQVGVLEHTRGNLRRGVRASKLERIRLCRSFDPLSMPDCCDLTVGISYTQFLRFEESVSQSSCLFSSDGQSQIMMTQLEQVDGPYQGHDGKRQLSRGSFRCRFSSSDERPDGLNTSTPRRQVLDGGSEHSVEAQALSHIPLDERFPCFHYKVQQGTVSSIEFIREDLYFDLHVPGEEHYLAEGVWNHNTGKSRSVLEKIHLAMMKYPGARALLVRKTRESMTQSVLQTLEDHVIPVQSPVREGPSRKLRANYTFPNGSEIIVGGMDNPAKIMSTEYDLIGVFEGTELTEEDHENLTTRLRNGVMPYQQIIVDCNPRAPSHWLNKRANKQLMTRLFSRHRDNPVMFDRQLGDFTPKGKQYLARLSRLTGARRARLLEGKWQASEGAVYDVWDEAIHTVAQMPTGWETWRKVRSIDFGYKNPFVCLWGAVNHDGDIYVYREMYFSNRIVKDHASGIWDQNETPKRLIRPGIVQLSGDEIIEATVADHDAEDRATLDAEGVDSVPAHKDILPGIEAVYDRLRPQLHGDGTIRPRLYFLRDCLVERDEELIENNLPFNTVQEFDGYVWAKLRENAATTKNAKEEPVDKDNHGMDTIRYLVAYVDDLRGDTISVSTEAPSVVDGNW